MSDTIRAASFLDKGGTGKTTAIAHLGVALSTEGYRVLLIDLAGKQGDLSKQFGIWQTYQEEVEAGDAWPNVTTVFQDEWQAIVDRLGDEAVKELILSTEEFVDIIPSHPGLDTLDAELGNIDDATARYSRLEEFLDEYIDPLEEYDVVLIDLPGLSNNVTYNGLWASRNVIAPVEMGPFESDQAGQLRNDLNQMEDAFEIPVNLVMVLPNKVDPRTRLSSQYLDEYEAAYPDAIAPQPVPRSQDIRNAAEDGRTVFRLDSPSQTAQEARNAFLTNARELVDRIQSNPNHD